MKFSRIFIFIISIVAINCELIIASSNDKWDIKTINKLYQNVDVLAIEGENLKITNRKGDGELIPISAIIKIQKMTPFKNVLYGACGGYLGLAAGAFIGWPLFPKWGNDEGHMNGYKVVMILGGVAGVIFRKQVVEISKNLLKKYVGFPIGRPGMERWTVDQKKIWIRNNVFLLK